MNVTVLFLFLFFWSLQFIYAVSYSGRIMFNYTYQTNQKIKKIPMCLALLYIMWIIICFYVYAVV